MAKEFKLDPIITGAREAEQVVGDLKAAERARDLQPELPDARRVRCAPGCRRAAQRAPRRARNAPKGPARSTKAGVPVRVRVGGPAAAEDFVRNAAQRGEGRPVAPTRRVRALTIDAAHIAGAADRLGSLEKGKIANLIVTDGDLFEDSTASCTCSSTAGRSRRRPPHLAAAGVADAGETDGGSGLKAPGLKAQAQARSSSVLSKVSLEP